jgi:hypothetical protein
MCKGLGRMHTEWLSGNLCVGCPYTAYTRLAPRRWWLPEMAGSVCGVARADGWALGGWGGVDVIVRARAGLRGKLKNGGRGKLGGLEGWDYRWIYSWGHIAIHIAGG